MLTDIERFAFNQARFVFHAAFSIDRDEARGIPFDIAFRRIQATPLGQRYLRNVSRAEMKHETREPGSFMDANTDLGRYCNGEYGQYAEDFIEK